MKKTITLFLALLAVSISYGQNAVPLTNADIESSTAMTSNGQIHAIDGMFVQEAVDGAFDEANSGLASGEGVGGSQAFKIVTTNNGTTASWHTQFAVNQTDISGYGYGDFIFSFQLKAASAPASYPIWMVIRTFDEDGNNVSSNTITNYTNGGRITPAVGDESNTTNNIADAYQTAWVTFSLAANNAGGKDAKFVELRVQMAKEVNTYYIDNVALSSSNPLSVQSFEAIGVSMYPNPSKNGKTFIKSNSSLKNVTLHSLTGQLVVNKDVKSNNYALDTSSLAKGVYLLGITNEKGKSTKKLIVQ